MKTYLITSLLLLFSWNITFSQVIKNKNWKNDKAFYHKVFDANDPLFDGMDSPAEFESAPVVILGQKKYFAFRYGTVAGYGQVGITGSSVQITRRRVKIQASTAIADFSEFYFTNASYFGIKLIKPDGSEQVVDVSNAVKVSTEVPRFYKDLYKGKKYYKMAIPNLEVGDILDYYTLRKTGDNYEPTTSFVTTISEVYPIVKQQYIIDIPRNWSFLINSLNGAPDAERKILQGANAFGKTSKGVKRFTINDEHRAALDLERWSFPYTTEPTLKIQTFPSMLSKPTIKKDGSFVDMTGPVSFSNIAGVYAKEMYKDFFSDRGLRDKYQIWKRKIPAKAAEEIYYYLRYMILPEVDKEIEELTDTYRLDQVSMMKKEAFFNIFQTILRYIEVPYELVFAVPTTYGPIESAIATEEVVIGIYVKSNRCYYFAPDNYSKPGEFPIELSGAIAYQQPPSKSKNLFDRPNKVILPIIDADKNVYQTNLAITVKEDLKTIQTAATFEFSNGFRPKYSELFLFNEDYKTKDESRLHILKNKKYKQNLTSEKIKKSEKQKIKLAKAEKETIKLKAIKAYFEEDYSMTTLDDFKVLNTGRYGEEPLKVSMEFTSEGLLNKAGKNHILAIGSLIGEQATLDQAETNNRKEDVQFGAAKTYKNTIQVRIPAGYTIEGIDNLNVSVDNAYLSFVSQATMNNEFLELTTEKVYKKASVPQADWNQVVEVLETAYKFSQVKVILKKQTGGASMGNK